MYIDMLMQINRSNIVGLSLRQMIYLYSHSRQIKTIVFYSNIDMSDLPLIYE